MDKELQTISVRKAKLVDAGKVRYRVYTSPGEFVVVIAESALMAVRLSGVATPHKIVRELGFETGSIDAQRMAPQEEVPEQVNFTTQQAPRQEQHVAEMPERQANAQTPFEPMRLGDLPQQGQRQEQILSPNIANDIVEEIAIPEPPVSPPAPPVAAAVQQPAASAPPQPAAPESAPAISPEQKLAQMADDLLPPAPEATAEVELSPEEVEKLLNG